MGESVTAKSKAGFGHDNILKILDVVTMDGYLGIVMPKLAMSLGGAIESKVLDRSKKVTIAHGLLSALNFLHDNGMMHRDVKSDNVMLDENFRPILIDFSLAKLLPLDDNSSLITDGSRTHTPDVGTASYIAPEVYRKESYGNKSDAYSAGVVLLTMFAGEKLAAERDKAAIALVQKLKDQLPSAAKPVPTLLRALLEEDPDTRRSCREVLGGGAEPDEKIKIITTMWGKNGLPTAPPTRDQQRVVEDVLSKLGPQAEKKTQAPSVGKKRKGGGGGESAAGKDIVKAVQALECTNPATLRAAKAFQKSTAECAEVELEHCVLFAMKMNEDEIMHMDDCGDVLNDETGFDYDLEQYQEAEAKILEAMNYCVFVAPHGEEEEALQKKEGGGKKKKSKKQK
jgi:hypothetical protein